MQTDCISSMFDFKEEMCMFCKNCGQMLNDGQQVCLNCGVKAGSGSAFCANCGNQVTPGADVCTKCGASVKAGGFGKYDKMTIALICFFLGGLGIHNFMLGENKKGIVRIVASLCFGLGYILALIDFVKILTDNYTVDPNGII